VGGVRHGLRGGGGSGVWYVTKVREENFAEKKDKVKIKLKNLNDLGLN